MSQAPFVHLHNHTEFSLLDGINRVKPMIKRATEYGMPAVAITDHGNMFGVIEFYKAARNAGIKPLIGCEVYIEPPQAAGGSRPSYSHHLILLAKNHAGYQNLIRLVSHGYIDGFYYKPRISKEMLAKHSGGLVCTSACLAGEVAWNALRDNEDGARQAVGFYQDVFGKDDFYLEIMDHDMEEQRKANGMILDLSRSMDIPLVATNDCHYLDQTDSPSHEVWLCVQTGRQLTSKKRMMYPTDEFYFKSGREMWRRFRDYPKALLNTVAVAEKIDLEIEFGRDIMPDYETPNGESTADYLRKLSEEGLEKRIHGRGFSPAQRQVYEERLSFELKVIVDMQYPAYFLIVWDFIHHAHQCHIPVGPGRGSAAGSLVAYSLGITNIDPIQYNLVFERFLNPERVTMPDIDIDFCKRKRDQVIDYVAQKYGRDNVAQIITFGTSKARNVLRDVGRVLGLTYGQTDKIAKLVPEVLNITLDEAIEQEPRLRELIDSDDEVARLIQISRSLEGITRHASVHAAGVVISQKPISQYVPLYKDSKKVDIVTQFDMRNLEQLGLLKMDFLGLKTLTVIEDTLRFIEAREGERPDLDTLPLDDTGTYDLLGRGDTDGVFQVESSGMKELLRKLKPNVFEDIIALVALYRPGPLGSGMVDDFIDRKHGRKPITYPHPRLSGILKDTYGVILYQEQVMQIASELAGFTMGQADLLRRAMGKKKMSVMEEQRKAFLDGAEKEGTNREKADEIFELMAKFAEYGFNKSHSAAYALLTYQTAYFKVHHAAAYYAAWLTNDVEHTDKVVVAINDASAHGIELLAPDVNESARSFTVISDRQIRFGLAGIKNVGRTAVDSILEARTGEGRFTSLYDLCRRVDLRAVNRRVLERLIKCGSCSTFSENRAALIEILDRSMESAARDRRDEEAGQMNLFGGDEFGSSDSIPLPDINEYPKASILEWEKEFLGFFLSGHPLDRFADDLGRFADTDTSNLGLRHHRETVRICGLMRGIKELVTKRKNKMARAVLEDLRGTTNLTIYPTAFEKCRDLLVEDQPVLVIGEMESYGGTPGVVVDRIVPLAQLREERTRIVRLTVPHDANAALLGQLRKLIHDHEGECPVALQVHVRDLGQLRTAALTTSGRFRVNPSDEFFRSAEQLLGEDNVSTQ